MSVLYDDARRDEFDFTSHFREDFYACLVRRGDTLLELCDAMLCKDGPVTSPVDLTMLAEHRRGHGAARRLARRSPRTGWTKKRTGSGEPSC